MSIEMDNPQTLVEKIDAAANYVAQIRIASMVGDKAHITSCVDKASKLLFDACLMAEEVKP